MSAHKSRKSLKASRRALFLLKEFGRVGEDLELPEFCEIEFPDADVDPDAITASKYKRLIVHVSPREGLYAGGTFRIELDVTHVPEYPDKPPKAKMLTKMWHVNVSNESICHNYLKADAAANGDYTPVLGMQGVINGLLTLFFGLENPDDPLNLEAAKQYTEDHEGYCKRAREWTAKYAAPVEIPKYKLADKG
jgi:ubiquitin-protein ligase